MKISKKLVGMLVVITGLLISINVNATASEVLRIVAPVCEPTDSLAALVPEFEAKEGVKVDIVTFDYMAMFEKMVAVSREGLDTYDVLFLDDAWIPLFIMNDWIVALDEMGYTRYQEDPDVFQVLKDINIWPPPYGPIPPGEENKTSHYYGACINGNIHAYAIRKDILDAKGLLPPETWEEALTIAEKVHQPNKLWGFVLAGEKSFLNTDHLTWLASYGTDDFDENWRVPLDEPKGMQALQMMVDLAKYSPPDVTLIDSSLQAALYAAGRGMQATMWPGDVVAMIEDPDQSLSAGKLLWMQPPGGPGGRRALLGCWSMVITQPSSKKELALKFIDWATGKEIQKRYAATGGIPVTKSAFRDPEIAKGNPHFLAMADALEAGPVVRPRTPEGLFYGDVLGSELNGVIAGMKSLEEAVKVIKEKVEGRLEEMGYYR